MNSSNAILTIITPIYNQASFLPQTINSVLSQDLPGIEYFVLDDGSTDDIGKVRAEFEGRVRWYSHPNMGESATVNRGLEMATGKYIVIVSADDPLLPGYARKMVEFLEANPNLLGAYPDWQMIDERGAIVSTVRSWDWNLIESIRWHVNIPGPGAMFRATTLGLVNGRTSNYRYIADYDFWLRVGFHGDLGHVKDVLCTWRYHSGGTTIAARGKKMADEHIRITEELLARPDFPAAARKYQRQARASAAYVAGINCLPMAMDEARAYLRDAIAKDPFGFRPGVIERLSSLASALACVYWPGFATWLWHRRRRFEKQAIDRAFQEGRVVR